MTTNKIIRLAGIGALIYIVLILILILLWDSETELFNVKQIAHAKNSQNAELVTG